MTTRLLVFGATGNLGRAVVSHARSLGLQVTAAVRDPARLGRSVATQVEVRQVDLAATTPAALAETIRGHDAVVNVAGHVSNTEAFVALVDVLVQGLEALPEASRPPAWFLAGAALLELDSRGRRGVDLPGVGRRYRAHALNFERLTRSSIDWRLLCPGPMVDEAPLGLERLRVATQGLPSPLPSFCAWLPGPLVLPFFVRRVPELTVPYADAAAVMLANLGRGGPMSRQRVGLALPVGMRKHKRDPQ